MGPQREETGVSLPDTFWKQDCEDSCTYREAGAAFAARRAK